MKIAFVFIVKDGESYLKKNLDQISKYGQDIYAVENNSTDNTKQILKDAGLTKIITLDLDEKMSTDLCSVEEKWNCSKRIGRLAYIRQNGLDAVLESGINYDYLCMLDMDFISYDEKGLDDMFRYMENNSEVDAIFGMSKKNTIFGEPYDIDAIEPRDVVYPIMFKYERYIRVDSAFSGFGVYRYSSILEKKPKYSVSPRTEHQPFNDYFENKVVDTHFNPVYEQPSHITLLEHVGFLVFILILVLYASRRM